MKIIITLPHEIYDCDKVIEVFDSEFCKKAKWTVDKNVENIKLPGKIFILDDNIPVDIGWKVINGNPVSDK
jgi:ABC-type polysaccharide/polyol phosphate transport system ATPase subunit